MDDDTFENIIVVILNIIMFIVTIYILLLVATSIRIKIAKKVEDIEVSMSNTSIYSVEIPSEYNISTQILINCSIAENVSKIDIYGVTQDGRRVYLDTFPFVEAGKDLDFHDISSKYVKYILEFVAEGGKTLNILCTIKHNRIEV